MLNRKSGVTTWLVLALFVLSVGLFLPLTACKSEDSNQQQQQDAKKAGSDAKKDADKALDGAKKDAGKALDDAKGALEGLGKE